MRISNGLEMNNYSEMANIVENVEINAFFGAKPLIHKENILDNASGLLLNLSNPDEFSNLLPLT